MTLPLHLWSATALTAAYRAGTVSPVEAARACLDKISELNQRYNAIILVAEPAALAAAAASEARWRSGRPASVLDGVPATVKDLILTAGWSTLYGSKTTAPDQPWREDAPAVARLKEAGVVLLGKTATPEFGHKGVTDSPLHGVTRNPWNAQKTPGGSSGGAAVAAATGMGVLHLGSDGGGSLRIPASFTGVFGFKPSAGLVPSWPPSVFSTLSAQGPVTRSVEDAALTLDEIAKPDGRDWQALPFATLASTGNGFAADLETAPEKLRIAYAPTLNGIAVDAEVAALVRAAALACEDAGAVEEIAFTLDGVEDCFNRHWMAAASAIVAAVPPEKRALMDKKMLHWARLGDELPLLAYTQAQLKRADIGIALNTLFSRYDILLMPTMALPAFDAVGGDPPTGPDGQVWDNWTPFTYPFNLGRQPAASIPCGFTKAGLPVGLQIVSGIGRDALVLRMARFFERRRPVRIPPV